MTISSASLRKVTTLPAVMANAPETKDTRPILGANQQKVVAKTHSIVPAVPSQTTRAILPATVLVVIVPADPFPETTTVPAVLTVKVVLIVPVVRLMEMVTALTHPATIIALTALAVPMRITATALVRGVPVIMLPKKEASIVPAVHRARVVSTVLVVLPAKEGSIVHSVRKVKAPSTVPVDPWVTAVLIAPTAPLREKVTVLAAMAIVLAVKVATASVVKVATVSAVKTSASETGATGLAMTATASAVAGKADMIAPVARSVKDAPRLVVLPYPNQTEPMVDPVVPASKKKDLSITVPPMAVLPATNLIWTPMYPSV